MDSGYFCGEKPFSEYPAVFSHYRVVPCPREGVAGRFKKREGDGPTAEIASSGSPRIASAQLEGERKSPTPRKVGSRVPTMFCVHVLPSGGLLTLSPSSRFARIRPQRVFRRRVQSSLGFKEDLSRFDPVQVKLLEEMCIAVDDNDNVVGPRTKMDCHLLENINKGLLHRAFSVFLFNMKGELLLQRRSDAKITFPGYYTNTCCSHPLHIASELEEIKALGVKRAAQRRLGIELGIDPASVPAEDFLYMTRILYSAPSDEKWGEREIDYVLIIQKDVDLDPNPNEVKDCIYVSQKDLEGFLDDVKHKGYKITPWFQLISETLLPKYWNNLNKLKPLRDHQTIHSL